MGGVRANAIEADDDAMTVNELISGLEDVRGNGFGESKVVVGRFSEGDGPTGIEAVDGSRVQLCCNGDGSVFYVLGTK